MHEKVAALDASGVTRKAADGAPAEPCTRSPTVVIDVRCIQDSVGRDGPVGEFAGDLLRGARTNLSADATIIALTSSELPPLGDEWASLFDYVRPNSYAVSLDQPSCFIELSPLTHDPMFVARLAGDAGLFRAAVVHDFPSGPELDDLPSEHRLRCRLAQFWLRRYNLLFPTSQSVTARLTELVPSERIAAPEDSASPAPKLAQHFWCAVKTGASHAQPSPHVRRGHKPQVALLSPVPPANSGVALFTAASIPDLAELADVHVYSDTTVPCRLQGALSTNSLSSEPMLRSTYDRVVAVVGNSPFHTRIIDVLTRFGGACIQHDSRMLGFYYYCRGIEQATRQAERELGRSLRQGELEGWIVDERSCETFFMGELTAASKPFCVHSTLTANLVRERYGIDPVWLPMPIHTLWASEALTARAKEDARRDLAISPDEIAIATFGIVHSSKGVQECIWALKALRDWQVPAKLYFVGPETEPLPLELCRDLGLIPYIRFVAAGERRFIEESVYRRYLQAADFGIQLRRFGFGSISGALVDCISAGLPTVANEELAKGVEAPTYVRRVSNDLNQAEIAKALFELCQRRPDESHLEEERQAYHRAHNFAVYARQLCAALALDVGHATGG